MDFAGGRYKVIRELGRGGQKIVYLVEDTALEREAALSLMAGDALSATEAERLRREAQALAQMGAHPHVVTVYDLGEDGGRPFIVSEFVAGGDLAELIERGPLSIARALAITRDLLAALEAIERRGIVHRDLKPQNVWIDAAGAVKLGDFGLALSSHRDRLSISGAISGTPAYVAPEQLEGKEVDGRADLYALGCVLYELLTGRPPFIGPIAAVLSQHLHAEPTPPSRLNADVEPELERFVLALLRKNAADRPASAEAARAMLDGVTPTESLPPTSKEHAAPPSGALREAASSRSRSRAVLALIGVGGVIAWVALHRAPETAPGVPRIAIIAAKERSASVSATVAWALTARVIEEFDRYKEFRPVSPAGVLAAQIELLGDALSVADEAEVVTLARRLGAETVGALAIARAGGDAFTVAIHVYQAREPASGTSSPRERIQASDLDGDGPARVASRLVAALTRHTGLARLTDEIGVAARPMRFDAYQFYVQAQQYCLSFRFEHCEVSIKKALAIDPDNALYHSILMCALSYQGGRDAEATAAGARAAELAPRVTSRHERMLLEQDDLWMTAERARGAGDRGRMRAVAERAMAIDRELMADGDPWGFLYGAAVAQYFLEDREQARDLYHQARDRSPSFYGPYFEEAKLLRGDGTDVARAGQAAALIWTFIDCFPRSDLQATARTDAERLGLPRPSAPPRCPVTKSV